MKKRLFRLLACLACICLIFGDFSIFAGFNAKEVSAAPAYPSDEDFETIIPSYDYPNPFMIRDWTFSLLKADGTSDNTSQISVNNDLDEYDRMLDLFGENTKTAVVKSNAGSFKLNSIKLNNENAPLKELKIEGYKNGILVQGAVGNLTSSNEIDTIEFTGSAWQNIDEFRVSRVDGRQNTFISIFSIDVDPPVEPMPPTPAVAEKNTVDVLDTVMLGESIMLTATGDRQSATGSVINDERYIPISWSSSESEKNGNFTESNSVYTSIYTPSIAGDYNISVIFQKQTWVGDSWINAVGQTDTETVDVKVNRPLDMMPPLPGNNGLISSSDVTPTKVKLNWSKATANVTDQGYLEYQVYQSNSNNIDTVSNVEANGTALGNGFTKDLNTLAVTGLTPNTTYYFNVLVKDAAGNKSVYTMQQVTTMAGSSLLDTPDGNLIISPDTPGNKMLISSASGLPSGNLALSWRERNSSNVTLENYIDIYSASGNKLKSINITSLLTPRSNDKSDNVNLLALENGNILVQWDVSSINKGFDDAYFFIMNEEGQIIKPATKLHNEEKGLDRFVKMAQLSNGDVAFVWTTGGNLPGSTTDYALRIFDSEGNAKTSQISLPSLGGNGPTGSVYTHEIAANNSGSFMIVYDAYNFRNYMGMLFNNDGTPKTVNGNVHFPISDVYKSGSAQKKVESLSNGNFVVSFKGEPVDVASRDARVAIFQPDGTKLSETILKTIGNTGIPTLINLADGGYVLADFHVTNTQGAYIANRYDNEGNLLEEHRQISDQGLTGPLLFAGYHKGLATIGHKNNLTEAVVQLYGFAGGSQILTNAATPNIDEQPTNITVDEGDNATLSIAASGGKSLSYQWYSSTTNSTTDGTPISGATSVTYSASTDTAGKMYYYVVVTNTDNNATGNQTATATSQVVAVTVSAKGDSVNPVPGGNGEIEPSGISTNSVTLNWFKATDNVTHQGDLEYQVYQSNSNNIDTVSNVEMNGTALGNGFKKDLNTYEVTNLSPGTTYYFNVLVKDAAGNKNVYSMQQITTQNLKSGNADLRDLMISTDSLTPVVTLNPAFDKETVSYTANIPYTTHNVTVTPTLDDNKATVKLRINNRPEIPLQPFYLEVGKNTIDIIVTAEDQSTTKTYTVNVYRLYPAPPVSADDVNNSILGIKPSMEYQVNGGAWTTFVLANLPDLSGDKTVKVRYSKNLATGQPASEEAILTFTTNPKIASAPTITPTVTEEDTSSQSGLVITPHVEDANDVTHYKISSITGGVLYKNDGVSPIRNGDFITKAEGQSGLKFLPEADTNSKAGDVYAFKVQAALNGTGLGLSDITSAGITVTEVNDEPKANSDSLSPIDENSASFNIPLADLLANDWAGPDNESGQTLSITNVQSVDGGTVRLDGNDIVFTPNPNYRGTARFNYTIMDDGTTQGAPDPKTDESMVLISIEPRADQPTVTDAVTNEDEKSSDGLVITPTNAEGATTTHYKITGITGGSLYKNDGAFPIVNGDFITVSEGQAGLKFQPAEDQYGTTGFGFLIQAAPSDDGRKLSDAIQATIIVKEVNDNPIAKNDQLPKKELKSDGISITFADLLLNDSKGPENENDQTLTIISVENAVGGTATIQDGKVIFIPNRTGSASFDYTVQDNGTTNGDPDSLTDSGRVQFTVVSKPVIQLQGDNPLYIELGSHYSEPGYSAMDEVDSDLTDQVTISGIVDSNQLGIYPLNYNVVNSNGFSAVEMARTVQVVSADLKTLSVSAGDLTPLFDKTKTNYNLTVPANTAKIDISASTLDVTASASIDNHISGNAGSESISLQPGTNTITVVVTAKGGLTKTYTLQITREPTNAKAPTIVQQPINKSVTVDEQAHLSVAAEADIGTLSYQWYSNTINSTTDGTLIPGATNETYSAPTVMAGTTYYYAIVTNTDNSATGDITATTTSEVAEVTVNPKSTNAYLAGITVSNGALSPAFTKDRETYTVNVANSVSAITLAPIVEETGKAAVTVNGQPSKTAVSLTIGANIINVIVTAEDGVTKNTYTITVYRAQPATSGGEGTKPVDPQPEPAPQPTTEQIVVDVDGSNGSNLAKTPITRTTETNGTVKDKVAMTDAIAKETVQKAKEQGVDTARIMIPDKEDKVSEIRVEIPKSALAELNSGNLKLEIVTANAVISIPTKSIDNFNGDLYFRLVPVKSVSEKQQIEERAKKESIIQEAIGDNKVQVVGRPMEIETNMQSREVSIVLPLTASLPINTAERENLLDNLGVYIEHSDGSKELIKGTVVKVQDGKEGLQFSVNKFSTFTMVYLEGWAEEEADHTVHTPYIKGYANNEFRPDAPVTRAQMATMLANNLDVTPSTSTYKDVSKKHGAYKAILEVREAGIMTGKTATTFDPNGTVTRAQMAAIVYRWVQKQCEHDADAYASCGIATNVPAANFTDVKDSHWAKEAMDFTKAADIMVGEGNKFQPEANLTRAQAVKVLNRLFKRGPLANTGTAIPTFKDVPATHWAFGEIEEAAREHNSSIDKK